MPDHDHPQRTHHRHRWWRRWLKRLPQKLLSRRFNLYQALLTAVVAYLAFQVVIYLMNNSGAPPE
jgi:hypothetical protein